MYMLYFVIHLKLNVKYYKSTILQCKLILLRKGEDKEMFYAHLYGKSIKVHWGQAAK